MADFVHRAIDLAGKLLPFDQPERRAANPERGLHLGTIEFGAEPLARLLARKRGGLHPFFQLLEFLVQQGHVVKVLGRVTAYFEIGRRPFLHIAQIYYIFELDGSFSQLFG